MKKYIPIINVLILLILIYLSLDLLVLILGKDFHLVTNGKIFFVIILFIIHKVLNNVTK
jgi:hypothetical protein